jgi:putative transposase
MSLSASTDPWARFRFAVVAPLLASPPPVGQLQAELARLAEKLWQHPKTGRPVRFGRSTIERWYYAARSGCDPIGELRRRPRRDRGQRRAIDVRLGEVIRAQHAAHPSWSYALHRDNLAVVVAEDPRVGRLPSYATLRRYLVAQGLCKEPRRRRRRADRQAEPAAGPREVRSFEVEHVGGLWHLDFHHGSRKILDGRGNWQAPILLAILDDRSRLVCHAQWAFAETAEALVHGLAQAFMKRGLPRALLTDNGAAMLAAETTEGLDRLSILHRTTLPYSAYQNGKQEVFWAQVEGRLIAMLEGEPDLPLSLLNRATLAWVEMEYHRKLHAETGQTPLDRWLAGPTLARPCPSEDDLRRAFTARTTRTQRKSDGTFTLAGTRFEVPARLRPLTRLTIRFASWDRRTAWIIDEASGAFLERCYPLNRAKNADGFRPPRTQPASGAPPAEPAGMAPLLRHLLAEYAATGLPPAYLPLEER